MQLFLISFELKKTLLLNCELDCESIIFSNNLSNKSLAIVRLTFRHCPPSIQNVFPKNLWIFLWTLFSFVNFEIWLFRNFMRRNQCFEIKLYIQKFLFLTKPSWGYCFKWHVCAWFIRTPLGSQLIFRPDPNGQLYWSEKLWDGIHICPLRRWHFYWIFRYSTHLGCKMIETSDNSILLPLTFYRFHVHQKLSDRGGFFLSSVHIGFTINQPKKFIAISAQWVCRTSPKTLNLVNLIFGLEHLPTSK